LAAAREKLRAPDMKQFTIVVKPFRAEAVLRAVGALNVTACVVQEAKGYGRQKGYLDRYAGGEYSLAYLPKVEITIWVSEDRADAVADSIVRAARTGRIGDGKILMVDVAWPEPLEF
jgi:nitrogen regulatory protein P-II 2